jgi:flagellar biogenesis protein FliO
LANEPAVRKRPVRASRTAAPKRSAHVARPLEDEAPTTNYALRLTESLEEEPTLTSRRGLRAPAPAAIEEDSFALRLNEALQAISSAQNSGGATSKSRDVESVPPSPASESAATGERANAFSGWLAALDKLPPIRLPIGPAIPWRLGLPALVAVVLLMAVLGRPAVNTDSQGLPLPAQQTYQVQQEAPLFAKAQPTETSQAPAAQPLGVQQAPGLGFDLADIGLKLIVVLALAYGSLLLLRRAGVGGAGASRGGGPIQAMRVVSSLALAPNRSVHVIKVPGGRTLLVGATPNAVNLIADLGELSDEDVPEAASFDFLGALKGKIGS